MPFLLRAPTLSDIPVLGRLHAETWHAAYAGLLPDRVLADVTVEARTAFWERILASGLSERREVLVAADQETAEPVGFAFTGPCRDPEPSGAGELYAIYVAPAQWSSGAGRLLIEGARKALQEAGFDTATLWVLVGNDRAIRFYERNGWRTDGVEVIRDVGDCPVPELRYRLSLAAGTSASQ